MTIEDQPQQPDSNEASRTPLTRLKQAFAASSFNSRMVIFSGIGCLAALLVLSVIAYSISRSNAMDSQTRASLNFSSSSGAPPAGSSAPQVIAKPSPIGRAPVFQPAPTPPAPRIIARQVTTPPPAPAQPSPRNYAAVVPQPPAAQPVQHLASSLPLGIRMAANRDGFNNGCKHGALIIETSTVTFTCPYDKSKSVAVNARQVLELDNNGILVYPRQKYHFDIAGKQKQDVHELFARWLENARRAATERASN